MERLKKIPSSPYIWTTEESSGDSVVTVSANSSNGRPMENDKSGLLDIRRFCAVATSHNFLIDILNNATGEKLSNQPIHASNILGKNGRDFDLPCPLYIEPTQSLFLTLYNLSDDENSIRLAFSGFKMYCQDAMQEVLRRNPEARIARPFFFTTDSEIELSSGETKNGYITTSASADFFLKNILSYSTGNYKFKIYDLYNGQSWTSGYIHSSMLGSAEYNKIIEPQLLQRKARLRIEFVDLSSATNKIYFTLAGINYNER